MGLAFCKGLNNCANMLSRREKPSMQETNPYKYLEQVSELFDTLNTPEEINRVLDELEYLFDLIEPDFQDQVSDLIARLTKRLQELD